jgi:cell division protein FtsI/penicillin-binding protein 2
MISDITDTMGNVKLKEYFQNKLEFDQGTEATFAGGGSGNVASFEKNLDCQYCYAQHGFGQGFAISPLQLARAYTAIANKGELVEPVLIEKIIDANGVIDDGTKVDSIISRPLPKPVFSQASVKNVTEYMKAVVDEGYLGQALGKNSIPGYSVAAKTGTAQITRQYEGKPCDYTCNTEKGLFDHTLVGFAPTNNPQILITLKISEPRRGQVTNFADTTLMPTFKEAMGYGLEYFKVPKDR